MKRDAVRELWVKNRVVSDAVSLSENGLRAGHSDFSIIHGVVMNEMFELRHLVVRQLCKLHTAAPHCDGSERDVVGSEIRNSFKKDVIQIKIAFSQEYF